ncbi:helix-turn-helix domain-containing protein [Streptomyces sp. NPDC056121]|uniref:helix-turn-helix domain-containing protein n=1 Tax=Streptomyces sp. NPDC056121 TaxID=3345718 RepID=UPI0035DBB5B9
MASTAARTGPVHVPGQPNRRYGSGVESERSPSPRVLAARRAVGERIRAAHIHANMTRESSAERAGLDRQSINRIEQSHASPVLDNLIRIADGLGVPLRDLA